MSHIFVVAEMSANHGGSIEKALQTVRAIKSSGADAIKIQTYTADTLTLNCDSPDFVVGANSLWKGKRLYDLYKQAYTPWKWHEQIFNEAKRIGLTCFSSPFDKTAVDLLESLGNPIYKIASPEITDIPLIEYAASKGKPMVISTGIATIEDINLAISACRKVGNDNITLLKCTTAYPAPIEDVNLATINDMRKRFNVNIGISDHTLGDVVAIGAAALGVTMIEKHFIVDREWGGPDSAFSMNAEEFSKMINAIRQIEKATGQVFYPTDETPVRGRRYARSLYIAKDIHAGEILTAENLRSVRPSFGLHPKFLPKLLGKKVICDLAMGTAMKLDYISKEDKFALYQ